MKSNRNDIVNGERQREAKRDGERKQKRRISRRSSRGYESKLSMNYIYEMLNCGGAIVSNFHSSRWFWFISKSTFAIMKFFSNHRITWITIFFVWFKIHCRFTFADFLVFIQILDFAHHTSMCIFNNTMLQFYCSGLWINFIITEWRE